jgi:hypothetical protein
MLIKVLSDLRHIFGGAGLGGTGLLDARRLRIVRPRLAKAADVWMLEIKTTGGRGEIAAL